MFLDGVWVPSVASTAAPTAGLGAAAFKLAPHVVLVVAWLGLHAIHSHATVCRATPPLLSLRCPPGSLQISCKKLALRATTTTGSPKHRLVGTGPRRMESYNSHPPSHLQPPLLHLHRNCQRLRDVDPATSPLCTLSTCRFPAGWL